MENSKTKAAVVKQVKVKVSSKKPIAEVALPKVEDKPKKTVKEKVAEQSKEKPANYKTIHHGAVIEKKAKEKVAKAEKVETISTQEIEESVPEQEFVHNVTFQVDLPQEDVKVAPKNKVAKETEVVDEIKPTHDVTVGRRLQVQHYLDLGITSPTQISKLTGCNLSYVARLKK